MNNLFADNECIISCMRYVTCISNCTRYLTRISNCIRYVTHTRNCMIVVCLDEKIMAKKTCMILFNLVLLSFSFVICCFIIPFFCYMLFYYPCHCFISSSKQTNSSFLLFLYSLMVWWILNFSGCYRCPIILPKLHQWW